MGASPRLTACLVWLRRGAPTAFAHDGCIRIPKYPQSNASPLALTAVYLVYEYEVYQALLKLIFYLIYIGPMPFGFI